MGSFWSYQSCMGDSFLFGWDVHFLYTVNRVLFFSLCIDVCLICDPFSFLVGTFTQFSNLGEVFFFTPSAAFTTTIEWTVRWDKFLTFVFSWSFQFVSDPGVVYFNSTTIIDLVNVRKGRSFTPPGKISVSGTSVLWEAFFFFFFFWLVRSLCPVILV